MGAFGGFTLTNKGRNLQAKAQVGAVLNYTRAAIGDGTLTGQSIITLTALISAKKTLLITKLRMIPPDRAAVGTIISNQSITTGFYFREIGIFAQDPDEGEILYAYANSGSNAEYLPPAGGPDVIEKSIDMLVVVGRASQVTATIDSSLVFATLTDVNDALNDAKQYTDEAVGDIVINDASTTQKGIVQLDNTVGGSQSTDKAVVPKALLDSLALKQDVLRLADNFVAATKLINDTSAPVYPNGVSMFKVSSGSGWPAANGYVLTFRAGSGGYQIFYEMYTGNVQTDKTARQWTRSKRDSNAFWQDWSRALTEVDLTAINTEMAAVKKSVSDGKILVRNSITAAKGIVADADGDGIPSHAELVTGVGTILARATADANLDPAYLLTGYSGYDDGIRKAGTMPNLTGVRIAQGAAQWGDGGLAVYPERGYQKGGAGDGEIKVSQAQLIAAEPDLSAGNIRSGVNMFGVVGTLIPTQYYEQSFTLASSGNGDYRDIYIPFVPKSVSLIMLHPTSGGYYALAWASSVEDNRNQRVFETQWRVTGISQAPGGPSIPGNLGLIPSSFRINFTSGNSYPFVLRAYA